MADWSRHRCRRFRRNRFIDLGGLDRTDPKDPGRVGPTVPASEMILKKGALISDAAAMLLQNASLKLLKRVNGSAPRLQVWDDIRGFPAWLRSPP
jgi:hypothetical protein